MSYKIQIDDEVRQATDEEIELIKSRQDDIAQVEQAVAHADAAKASARAKLKALGLTDDEIAALIP